MADTAQTERESGVEEVLQDILTCPQCGHDNPPRLRYCDNCGKSLMGVEPGQPSEPAEEKKKGFFARLFGR